MLYHSYLRNFAGLLFETCFIQGEAVSGICIAICYISEFAAQNGTKRGINFKKHQICKMYHFCSTLQINSDFETGTASDTACYNLLQWVLFCECNLAVEVGVTKKLFMKCLRTLGSNQNLKLLFLLYHSINFC